MRTIYYHKNSKVAKFSVSVSHLHIDVILDFHISISEESRMNDDSMYFHLNPFEEQGFRRKCQEKPFHREI